MRGGAIDQTLSQEIAWLACAFAKAGIGDEAFRLIYHASGADGADAFVKYLAEQRIIEPKRVSALRMVLRGYVTAPLPLMLGDIDGAAAKKAIQQARRGVDRATSRPALKVRTSPLLSRSGREVAVSSASRVEVKRPSPLEEEIATELEEIRFFMRVDLLEDAREVLKGLMARFPEHDGLRRALDEFRSSRIVTDDKGGGFEPRLTRTRARPNTAVRPPPR